MISVSDKKWVETKVNKNLIEKTKQDLGIDEILSKLIISRNFDKDEINSIHNNHEITNIFINNYDFNSATDLLIDSINNKENIFILGDYDVDGCAATSLLVRFFNYINYPCIYYIPDRINDGYGASKKLFENLILKKPKLIIMVDCGSTSNDAIDYLNKHKIKSIIIDHHEIHKPYPKATFIINLKKSYNYINHDYFCATALTYFFLEIIIKKMNLNFVLSKFLIYVALATVCDVMPLRKINRTIVSNVLRNFKQKDNIVFNHLFEYFEIKRKLTIEDFGFLIGPIINSGGRLGFSKYGVELLTSDNNFKVKKKLQDLIKLNNKRKEIEKNILNQIDYKKIKNKNSNIILYYDPSINEGLIGIIAARLMERFNKPSIVITKSNNLLKGSARSTVNYNIGILMKKLLDKKIIDNGGGHNMAAGFTIKKNRIKELNDFIENDINRKNINLNVTNLFDLEISSSAVNQNFWQNLDRIGPFGNENFSPTFLIKDLKVIRSKLLNGKHISAILKPKIGSSIQSICFNCVDTELLDYLLSYKKNINVIGQIYQNIWNNKKIVQINIKDILL